MDMAGNLWEWCLNENQTPGKTKPKRTNHRVVRGGSWNNNQDNARAAYRNNNAPDNLNNNQGFWLLCSSHTFVSLQRRRGRLVSDPPAPARAHPP